MTGEITGDARRTGTSVTLPPALILVLGLLSTGVCMLLLFGPFYSEQGSPGRTLQWALISLSDHLPRTIRALLWDRFFLVALIVFGTFLAVVPWRIAVHRQRSSSGEAPHHSAGFSTGLRVTRTEHNVSLAFADDGSIVSDDGDGQLTRSVSDLRMMAGATGIPWHTDYETEGGARAFLEVLRALHEGPAGVFRAEDHQGTVPTGPPGAAPTPSSAPGPMPSAAPETAPSAASGALPAALTAPSASVSASLVDDAPDAPDPTRAESGDAGSSRGYRLSEPTWTPSFSSSVYTSTDLYRSARTDSTAPDAADPEDDFENTAGER